MCRLAGLVGYVVRSLWRQMMVVLLVFDGAVMLCGLSKLLSGSRVGLLHLSS